MSAAGFQILVGMGMIRQTITYEGLSKLMYRKAAAGVLDEILGHIAGFCIRNHIPPLTAIVVGKSRGTPGRAIPIDPQRIDAEREKVYAFDWYNVYPPSENELKAAYAALLKGRTPAVP